METKQKTWEECLETDTMKTYKVKYYAGTFEGIREVQAEDEEEAIAKVRGWVRKNMSLPMYADGYKIIE